MGPRDLFTDTYGKYIRKNRKECGLSMAEVAERAGISDNYMGNIERGEKAPSLRVSSKLVKVLELDGTYMFTLLNEALDEMERVQ